MKNRNKKPDPAKLPPIRLQERMTKILQLSREAVVAALRRDGLDIPDGAVVFVMDDGNCIDVTDQIPLQLQWETTNEACDPTTLRM